MEYIFRNEWRNKSGLEKALFTNFDKKEVRFGDRSREAEKRYIKFRMEQVSK